MEKVERGLFSCPICLELPEEYIFQCKNGHMICQRCCGHLELCPQCRVPYRAERIRNRALEELIGGMEISCKNKESGCRELVLRRDLQRHVESCNFRPAGICKFIGYPNCDFGSCEGKAIFEHIDETHSLLYTYLGTVGTWSSPLDTQIACMKTGKGKHFFRHGLEFRENGTCVQFFGVSVVNNDDNEYSFRCLHFSDSGICPYLITIRFTAQDFTWEWTGKPTYYKNMEESLSNPPFKIPVRYLLENIMGDLKAVYEVAYTRK